MIIPEILRKICFYILFNLKKKNFKQSLSFAGNEKSVDKIQKKCVILPIIETSHYKYIQHLIIAKALQLRGARIIVLTCGESLQFCEIRSSINKDKDPCWRCRFGAKNYLPLFGFETISISDIKKKLKIDWPVKKTKLKKFLIETEFFLERCIQETITRHYYGKIVNNPKEYDKALHSVYLSWITAQFLHKKFNPDLILGYMAAYSEWEPILRYFENVGVDFRLITSTPFSNKAQMIDWPELYLSTERYKKFLKNRNGKMLSIIEKKQLSEFIHKRFSGNDDVMKFLGVARSSNLNNFSKILKKHKKVVAIFPNVHWDVGLSDLNTIFPSMMDWLYETIDFLGTKKNVEILLRLHPVEALYKNRGSTSIIDLIKNRLDTLPSNLTVIDADANFSSYSLFEKIDVGVTYNGSIGLEMLLQNVPTVISGKAHYSQIPGTFTPKSKNEYLKSITGEIKVKKPLKKDIELFSYFYFLKSSIPWNLTPLSYGAGNFDQFNFKSINDMYPGKDIHLDHLCNCIFNKEISPESWN